MAKASLAIIACLAAVLSVPQGTAAFAQGLYTDNATSRWFKSLSSPYTHACCDQADCHKASSDYRDGAWWALSNRTQTWVRIVPGQITSDASIFPQAILCEGDPFEMFTPVYAVTPRVFCFAIPPQGF